MPDTTNPLVSDRDVDFLLYEVLDAPRLCTLPAFAEHSRETFDLFLRNTRRLAREVLFPTYKPMDEQPARLRDGGIETHPLMKRVYPQLIELGLVNATRPVEVGGQQLPMIVYTLGTTYLGAGNLSAAGFVGLTTGAGHLIEAFGSDWLKQNFMTRMYSGEWTGTMALTEPHAGSSLADVKTTASPTGNGEGQYHIRGSKIFISGGDQDLTDNIVNMTLARIDGAPMGIKGVSLFAVPKKRPHGDGLQPNDVSVAGAIHKIGWRGLPSLALNFGEQSDCVGWLVGEPHKGISYMFQMMNEARIQVGASAAATASVAYLESLSYARSRPQGRALTSRDPSQPQVPIIEHADVRRMLLRQKAIVEGSFALVATAAWFQDLSRHALEKEDRHRAHLLLDLLTPVTKSFPAEKGFEANALAIQVHGGYGYSSEYLPESWLRDQKLNSIHEGTTGIHSMDLLGRKVVAEGGNALRVFVEEVHSGIDRARRAGVNEDWGRRLAASLETIASLTQDLAGSGLAGDVDRMMRHSVDYLELFSIVVVAWQWLVQAAAAAEGMAKNPASTAFYEGKNCTAQYWFNTELPRVEQLAELCRTSDDSYARMQSEWF